MTEIINGTTGGFSSQSILEQQRNLTFESFDLKEVGFLAEQVISIQKKFDLKMAVEVRLGKWTVFHISFPGTSTENDWWINRKSNVVNLTANSSLYERVYSEEKKEDWFKVRNLSEENFAIHGGGFPIKNAENLLYGMIVVSGLPQIEDHKIAIQILEKVKNER